MHVIFNLIYYYSRLLDQNLKIKRKIKINRTTLELIVSFDKDV